MPGPADYFQQGYQGLGSAAVDFESKNRDPHPAIKKRIMEMLHQGKDPRQAAIEAKLEMQGHIGGDGFDDARSAPPPQMTAYGDGSAPGMPNPTPQMRPPPSGVQQLGGQPVMSRPSVGPTAPERSFTMRDATDAKDLGLLHDPRALTDTPEDRYARALLRATTQRDEGASNRESREKQTTERVEGQKTVADAGLKEKQRQFDIHNDVEIKKLKQDWDKAVLRARTSIENARDGRASSKDVAALKAVLAYDSAIQAQISAMTKTGYTGIPMGSKSEVDARLHALEAQHAALKPQIEDALKKAQQVMGAPGSESTSELSKVSTPGPNLKAPDTSVPKGVGEMPVLPNRFKTRDGRWVKKNPATGRYLLDPNQRD